MRASGVSREDFEKTLLTLDPNPPVEQLGAWADYEATIDGRSPWGWVVVEDDGKPVACAAFTQYETHGYKFLRSHHAPVWAAGTEPTPEQETAVLEAIASYVHATDKAQAFMRLAVLHELPVSAPCLSSLPYDTTVIIDVTGGEDAILSRMKPRGRRDVRKSLRECPAECADETALAAADFAPYYQIMCETGARDGFTPAPLSNFQDMVRVLGEEHCRVYAARIDGEVVAWSMVTVSGNRATRYYAATTHEASRARVADKLVLFECEQAAALGCEEYDLMGIGSDFAPETKNLNEFKTKFAKEGTVTIAPDRDVPIKQGFYKALVAAKNLRARVRNIKK